MKTKNIQAIFSTHRMSIRKNDISNTYTFKMHPIITYDKHMFVASFLTFNNILFCIRKMLDKCHPQTTNFTRQKQNRENVQILKLFILNKYLKNPYLDYSYSDVKNVQLYVNLYVFFPVLISEISRLSLTRHAFNVNALCTFTKRNSLHLLHSSHLVGGVFNHDLLECQQCWRVWMCIVFGIISQ